MAPANAVPLLEVCIPTRKRTDFFGEAVASVARAAPRGVELMVFQNSPEPFWREDDVAAFRGPVRLECSGRDLSMAESWNELLARSRAEWIHLLHDDDWVEPGFYETFLRDLATQPPFGFWLCGTTDHFSENGTARSQPITVPDLATSDPAQIAGLLLGEPRSRCVSVIMRQELALATGGFDPRMTHSLDVDLFLRVALAGGARFSPGILGNYRIHASSSTGMGNIFRPGTLTSIPILDDARVLNDHLVLLSKQTPATLRLPALRQYSAGLVLGAFRYYLRRLRIGSLLAWLKYFAHHVYAFYWKARFCRESPGDQAVAVKDSSG